ncbi:pilus assembly protein TadG-related protein [Streptomyces sp. GESEQ-35]|uniref:pilus assembly protein TadG-related protein n=1 Tax=Streptomyces sp. GESEQ-35 TaxID=2812657 RepID=UPI001B32A44E|nr:pilus assembly protein TadG-related protein [Streptomyces sp. GESEQ-35]
MPPRRHDDAGQAFPIYITVVAGLLFLAFAYLAVGQAAANRNGAQTAADAAALAAAQDRRDQLAGQWLENVLDPDLWQDIFNGDVTGLDPSCWRAEQLAAQNNAGVDVCDLVGVLGYRVGVKTDKPVGDSIVPGTEGTYSTAFATAVIDPLCTFELPGEDAGDDVLPQLKCKDGGIWEDLDPDDPTSLPGPEDLFDVHLADD